MKTKATSQRIRDTARILQSAGITLAKGDAARVEARLAGKPIKPALAIAAAGELGIRTRGKRTSLEQIRSDALQSLALGLLERTTVTEEAEAALYGTLAGWIDQDPDDESAVTLIRICGDQSLIDVLVRLHLRARQTSPYAIAERHACRILLASLKVHAEDLVHALDDDSIDALAAIATYDQAARLIEKKLVEGGPRDSLVSRYLTDRYRLPAKEFLREYLDPLKVMIPVSAHTVIQAGALHPQITARTAAIARE